jgi:hypothetical protein
MEAFAKASCQNTVLITMLQPLRRYSTIPGPHWATESPEVLQEPCLTSQICSCTEANQRKMIFADENS